MHFSSNARMYIARLLLFVLGLCLFESIEAKPLERNALIELRQEQAQKHIDNWQEQALFSTPVQAHIEPINPNSEAVSSQHETYFKDNICHIVVYVDPVHGTPTLPGLAELAEHEYELAFETVVLHELSHCAHFARGLRFEHTAWSPKFNQAMSVQMVMAQQMYNETRFVDAQMEHVADAHAALRLRQLHGDNPAVHGFLSKYLALRNHHLALAAERSGKDVYIQHATQPALRWGMEVPLDQPARTPTQWFNLSVQHASATALNTAKDQVAWGGLGALLCATATTQSEWSSVASSALARIAANDMAFMTPGPWRELPLDFANASWNMEGNKEVFATTYAMHALLELEELRAFATLQGADPIPLHSDKIGRPEGVVPMELAVGAAVLHGQTDVRQTNGCVAINPKH